MLFAHWTFSEGLGLAAVFGSGVVCGAALATAIAAVRRVRRELSVSDVDAKTLV